MREIITPNELEKALKVLPEPEYASVKLTNYDDQITHILREAEKTVPGVELSRIGGISIEEISLDNPTRERIMDVYRSSYGANDLGHPDFTKPRVELSRLSWDLRKEENEQTFESQIVMSPEEGFGIQYWGKEPEYISQLRDVLSESKVKIEIVANDYSGF